MIPSQSTSANGPPLTVAICDDRWEVRAAISTVLRSSRRFSVVGEATDNRSCLLLVQQMLPDVLILDVGMPGGGPRVARQARRLHPGIHILVFSGLNDAKTAAAMFVAGVDQYLVKTGRLGPLLDALGRADGPAEQATARAH